MTSPDLLLLTIALLLWGPYVPVSTLRLLFSPSSGIFIGFVLNVQTALNSVRATIKKASDQENTLSSLNEDLT